MIPSVSISGFGFVEKALFGFFSHEKRVYDPGEFHRIELSVGGNVLHLL